MKCEGEFDETAEFSKLEVTSLSGTIIHPITQVFYNPSAQHYHFPHNPTRLTEEAEKTTQEAIREAERIHRKYRRA